MKIKKNGKQHISLIILFSVVVFIILIGAIAVAGVAVEILIRFKIFEGESGDIKTTHLILFMAGISTILGTMITILALRVPLRPISTLINKMNDLSSGEYNTTLEYKGVIEIIPSFKSLSVSFNKLAQELRNTEMLRSDFINNFSHEFKTPIVSIKGFAGLLMDENISVEEKRQYIEVIEEEASRLSDMATNVLNLSKVEKQEILNDTVSFNVSEQIRSCVLLLENKWAKKNIELQIDIDEYQIQGNEELLKQVWINLIDNAIKFFPRCSTVRIDVSETDDKISVSIGNGGSVIPKEKLDKIWGKFYQTDESHSSVGNGIGLAIVDRVVKLHGGSAEVKSDDGWTEFKITLPKQPI